MTDTPAILTRLHLQRARIQSLVTPGLKQSSGRDAFAGRKFKIAAREMRVLTGTRLGVVSPRYISRLSIDLPQKFQGVKQMLHIDPKMTRENKNWAGVERVFHGQTVQARRETPASAPGEFRQGSIIPRMEMFPKPGQALEDFRQQAQALPRTPRPAEETPRKIAPGTKARLFTKVQEFTQRPPKSEEPLPEDDPGLADTPPRSPPAIEPAPVQRQVEPPESEILALPDEAANRVPAGLDAPVFTTFETDRQQEDHPVADLPDSMGNVSSHPVSTVSRQTGPVEPVIISRKVEDTPAVLISSPPQPAAKQARPVQHRAETVPPVARQQPAPAEMARRASAEPPKPPVSFPSVQRAEPSLPVEQVSRKPGVPQQAEASQPVRAAMTAEPIQSSGEPENPTFSPAGPALRDVFEPLQRENVPEQPVLPSTPEPVQREFTPEQPVQQVKPVQLNAAEGTFVPRAKPITEPAQKYLAPERLAVPQAKPMPMAGKVRIAQRKPAPPSSPQAKPSSHTTFQPVPREVIQTQPAVLQAKIVSRKTEHPVLVAKPAPTRNETEAGKPPTKLIRQTFEQSRSIQRSETGKILSTPEMPARFPASTTPADEAIKFMSQATERQVSPPQRPLAKPVQIEPVGNTVNIKPDTDTGEFSSLRAQASQPEEKRAETQLPIQTTEKVAPAVAGKPSAVPFVHAIMQRKPAGKVDNHPAPLPSDRNEQASGPQTVTGKIGTLLPADQGQPGIDMPLSQTINYRQHSGELMRAIETTALPHQNKGTVVQHVPASLIQPAKYRYEPVQEQVSEPLPHRLISSGNISGPEPLGTAAQSVQFSRSSSLAPVARPGEISPSFPGNPPVNAPNPSGRMETTISRINAPASNFSLPNVVQRTMTQEENPVPISAEKQSVNLESLAEDLLPIIKRLLSIEAERYGGSFR